MEGLRLVQQYEQMIQHFETISDKYIPKKELISDNLTTDLQVFVSEIREKIEGIVQNEKTLKVGIVGEVKAGKSSFLNAFLFQGKKVLPEAPTPMTAALTKISFSKQLKAEVFFYNRKDWEMIEELSHQYDLEYKKLKMELMSRKKEQMKNSPLARLGFNRGVATAPEEVKITKEEIQMYVDERISKEKKGCKELTQLVQENEVDVNQYLDTTEVISGVDSIEDLVGKLGFYVGSEGKLTPIVKSTNIYLDLPGLQDLEIIDTPGTNDPIVSRGLVTRKYLAQCDAIFLLSSASQFMTSNDVEFIVNTLPTEGIRKGIIVGSKFDNALLNIKPGGELVPELVKLRSKLTDHATHIVEEELRKNPDHKTLTSLKEYLPPQFVSSVLYSIAVKKGENLNELEEHILHRLKVTYPRMTFDADLFLELSNIDRIKDKEFQSIVAQKEEILEHKLSDTISGQSKRFKQLLETLQNEISTRLDNLSNYDKKQLEEKFETLMSKVNSSKSDVEYIFEKENISFQKKIKKLQQELREGQSNHMNVDISSESKQEYSHSSGILLWKKDHYQNVTYHYAKVNQVIDNVRNFTVEVQRHVMDSFNMIVDSEGLRKELKKAILDLLDLRDSKLKENEILNPIEILLNKLTIPGIQLDSSRFERMISDAFAMSVVENDQIHKLVSKQNEVMSAVIKETIYLLDQEIKKVSELLSREGKEFTNKVAGSMGNVLSELKSQLDSKEQYVNAYEQLQKEVEMDLLKLA